MYCSSSSVIILLYIPIDNFTIKQKDILILKVLPTQFNKQQIIVVTSQSSEFTQWIKSNDINYSRFLLLYEMKFHDHTVKNPTDTKNFTYSVYLKFNTNITVHPPQYYCAKTTPRKQPGHQVSLASSHAVSQQGCFSP